MHDMNKMQNKYKNPTTNLTTPLRKRQDSEYKYGKLYPGHYNTPPLREDLVPRSMMAPERNGRGKGKTKLLL